MKLVREGGLRLPRAAAVLTGAALAMVSVAATAAESVLTRIAADGVIRAGTRASAAPFAQKTAAGEFQGFSVDLLQEIRAAAERELGRPVRIELYEVTPSDRLDRVARGELDIVCGITTPTWDRERIVDFSLPFFRDGTRVMVYRGRAGETVDVGQLNIGVVKGTTTVAVLEETLPGAQLIEFPNMGAAMGGLEKGEVDGVANVGVVLLGLAERSEPRRSVVLLPRTRALATESLACVLPQNDSRWRDLVNRTLVRMFGDVQQFKGRYEEVYNRWFGRDGALFYPLDRASRDYLADVSIWAK
ncbi:MAG: amino acid ABC transporter substrate-binding protein [Defluviicoccus sp.]|nr:amino acid ABC transporter substrate-binding protein [Defluviicoccus sp.]